MVPEPERGNIIANRTVNIEPDSDSTHVKLFGYQAHVTIQT